MVTLIPSVCRFYIVELRSILKDAKGFIGFFKTIIKVWCYVGLEYFPLVYSQDSYEMVLILWADYFYADGFIWGKLLDRI
jgi:hypothetical protein